MIFSCVYFFMNLSTHSLFVLKMFTFFLPVYNYPGRPSMSGPPILKEHIHVIINSPT